jgi:hypothetical protein
VIVAATVGDEGNATTTVSSPTVRGSPMPLISVIVVEEVTE